MQLWVSCRACVFVLTISWLWLQVMCSSPAVLVAC